MDAALRPFEEKMRAAQMPEPAVQTFRHYYALLAQGTTGIIREKDIEPLTDDDLTTYEHAAAFKDAGIEAMDEVVAVKLNGGLGTSMGLDGPKCMLEARGGMTFLDTTIRQMQSGHTLSGRAIPLVLMNSFNTEAQSLALLEKYEDPSCGLPHSFLQHRFPKVLRDGLGPATWPANPTLEWNPPGHGDLYAAMYTSDILARLQKAGKRYAFVSNIDNLAAVLDPVLLGYFVSRRLPFMMEVVRRTPMHRKGGHLARLRAGGRLVLREIAQAAAEDLDSFQDVVRHRWFNTNNLWVDLERLATMMEEAKGVVKLPLIRNHKHLDPRDSSSPEVYQIETAMGAAVSLFDGAEAIAVPNERYAPVKKSVDLLVLRSDRFQMSDDFVLSPAPATTDTISVRLDERYYGKYDDLEARFPSGPPSLKNCEEFVVEGDVVFGKKTRVEGRATVHNTQTVRAAIDDGMVLTGKVTL
ncbi:MAG: UTP--glucose-1-phosphate uridylyltransferase [Chitinivibrionales bacterium]|nr:UTP--glucose-1-phosphate uridylyltransferase [Chitinivibrionales bacterium]MBD3357761.1 UTP--glucose-1-phosphate uridylyltransferase [Chitinivibrionales bacterium]